MKDKQRRTVIVGIFVIIGIFILISTIYLIGKKEYIFGKPVAVSTIFQDVKGLREGDKVRMSGIDIGTVSSLAFMKDNRVFVQLYIDQEQVEFLKKDAHVTIGSEGLMGSKVVMIIPGSPNAQRVNENDTLSSIEQVDIDDIIQEVNKSSKNIAIVTDELASITKKINRGDGVFGKIFTDTTLTSNLDDAVLNIAYITENLNAITAKVNKGQGIVGKIFGDTVLTSELSSAGMNINEIAQNFKEITDQINKGEGIFGRLFTDTTLTSNLFTTTQNLQYTSQSLLELFEQLNNDSSALNKLIGDPAFADSLEVLIYNLNEGVIEVAEAADAVERSGIVRLFSKKKKKKE